MKHQGKAWHCKGRFHKYVSACIHQVERREIPYSSFPAPWPTLNARLLASKSPGYHSQNCFLALAGRVSPVNVKTKEKTYSPLFLSPIFVFWVIMRRRSQTNNAADTFQPPVLGCPLSCGSLATSPPAPCTLLLLSQSQFPKGTCQG